MFKRVIAYLLLLSFVVTPLHAEVVVIDQFIGLARDPSADKIPDGAHDQFENVWINDGSIEPVKGRQRLNSTAATDTVINGTYYYENAAGTTKKLIVAESDDIVSYDTDGTNRTVIKSSETNEAHDFTQVGDTLYFTSTTDGLYKWTGSGSASAVGSVSAPSNVDFSATTTAGGLTSGVDAQVAAKMGTISVSTSQSTDIRGTGTCFAPSVSTTFPQVVDATEKTDLACTTQSNPSSCDSTHFCTDGWVLQCATTSTYGYKVTKFSSTLGIESEASSADTASLEGANSFSTDAVVTYHRFGNTTCGSSSTNVETENNATLTDVAQTATTGTLASAPSAPFDTYRIYRTVASGSEYFLVGQQSTGAFTDGKPDVSLGDPLDTTIDTITPPALRYLESYKNSLFTAEGREVRFSHLPVNLGTDVDTYWLETDKITIDGNKAITGLHRAADSLLIFTENSIQELSGYGAESFRLQNIADGVGASADETIETDFQGDLIFFAGTRGVYKLRTFAQPQDNQTGNTIKGNPRVSLVKISSPFLDSVFNGQDSTIVLNPSDYTSAHAYYDEDNNLYFLYIGQDSFVYDNITGNWSHVPATKMKASVYRRSPNAVGQGVVWDDKGFVFNNWKTYSMGAVSGTVTGNPTSSTSTTLTDSGASFNTTGSGLTGLWVYLDGETPEYRQITSNTGTQITVSPAWTTNPISADDYYIQYIKPEWRTKQYSPVKAPQSTKLIYFWFMTQPTTETVDLDVYSFENRNPEAINATAVSLARSSTVVTNGEKQINKLNTPMNSAWVQWGFRSFIHNTSASADPALAVSSYAMQYDTIDER